MLEAARIRFRSEALVGRLTTPRALLFAAAVAAVAGFELWISPANPPGFLPDEASMSYNAYELAHHLRDENGALLPLFIRSFGDYKSPIFTYALAGVFRVTGPSREAARGLAAVGVLAAVLLLGLLAYRRTGKLVVAGSVLVLAGLTPWLFEIGRAAYEVALEPLLICLFLLGVEASWRRRAWTPVRGALVGLSLSGIAFVYAAGRLVAPLFALALLILFARSRRRWFAACWGTFVLTALLPIAVYWLRHPGALTARYNRTSFATGSMAPWTIVWRAARNYLEDMNAWHWIVSGDRTPYVHTHGAGALFATVIVLALGSIVLALRQRQVDRFWVFTLVLLLVCPIPAALTKDRFYQLRLVPLPVLLVIVGIPAVAWLLDKARTDWPARAATAALIVLVAIQFGHFVDNFRRQGPGRVVLFDAGVPALLQQAFGAGGSVYVNEHEPEALALARWYAVAHDIPPARVVVPRFHTVPHGAVIFGAYQNCDVDCTRYASADSFWLARTPVPYRVPRLAAAAITTTASRLKIRLRTQGNVPVAGAPWAYLLVVTDDGKPWTGTASVNVQTRKGVVVDRVGVFPFAGSLLRGYVWAAVDQGKRLDFVITLRRRGDRVGSVDYEVFVQRP